jgi:exportin-1
LSLISTIVTKLNEKIIDEIPKILESVLECTLPMITKNFSDFPEHRINFFKLLQSINKHCFKAFFTIPGNAFKLIIDSIVWATKHQERNISETGLKMVKELNLNIQKSKNDKIINSFYRSFFVTLIHAVLFVLTDTFHLSGK